MMDITKYRRRPTCEVRIGRVTIGGENPVAVQSMTNTDTGDTAASTAQIERIDRAGGKIVRLTAQGRREGENLAAIVRQLRADRTMKPRRSSSCAATCDGQSESVRQF